MALTETESEQCFQKLTVKEGFNMLFRLKNALINRCLFIWEQDKNECVLSKTIQLYFNNLAGTMTVFLFWFGLVLGGRRRECWFGVFFSA